MENVPMDDTGRELLRLVGEIIATGDQQAIHGMRLNALAYLECVKVRCSLENLSGSSREAS